MAANVTILNLSVYWKICPKKVEQSIKKLSWKQNLRKVFQTSYYIIGEYEQRTIW